jgi:hypothetical protein
MKQRRAAVDESLPSADAAARAVYVDVGARLIMRREPIAALAGASSSMRSAGASGCRSSRP